MYIPTNLPTYLTARVTSDICKLRFDFEIMEIADPTALTESASDPAGVYNGMEVKDRYR